MTAGRHNSSVELHVLDEGPGFAPEFRDHAFERFTAARRRRGDGSGLGLAIVETIARAHDGSAGASDPPGRRRGRLDQAALCRVGAVEEALLAWFDEHGRDLPWRKTRDPYAILVSEVMLQQTQVARVVPRYLAWLERWPSVEALAAATPADVIREWQGLGYNRRAVNLHRAAAESPPRAGRTT